MDQETSLQDRDMYPNTEKGYAENQSQSNSVDAPKRVISRVLYFCTVYHICLHKQKQKNKTRRKSIVKKNMQ